MIKLDIELDKNAPKRLQKFAKAFPKSINKSLKKTTIFGKRLIVKDTPVKTGTARRSWKIIKKALTHFIITHGNDAPYIPALETGVKPFGPKKKKFLHFPIIKGNTIIAWVKTKRVKGFKAFKMVEKNIPKIQKFFSKQLVKEIRILGKKHLKGRR